MPKVKFIEDRSTREAKPQHFKAGQVYDLPAASCERWVLRGAAEYVTAAEPEKAEAGKPEPEKAEAGEGEKPTPPTPPTPARPRR